MPNDLNSYLAGAPNLQAYLDNHDGTVTDSVTHLMWEQAAPSGQYTLGQAISYCAALTLGGHSDWRVPSAIELVSILDFTQISFTETNAAIDAMAFPSTPAEAFISSTLFGAPPSQNGTLVYFSYTGLGQIYRSTGPTSGDVRCVR